MGLLYLLYFIKKSKGIIWIISEEKTVYKIQKLNGEYALVEDLQNKTNKEISWEDIENKIKNKIWKIGAFQLE